jgi:rhodanese-related sulfurtransferase
MLKNPFVQGVVLLVLAAILAVGSNAFAARERKLLLVGYYPHALKVPPREPERVLPTPYRPPAASSTAATTTAQSPAPGQPVLAIPTDTIDRPAGVPSASGTAAPGAVAPKPASADAPASSPAAQDPLSRFQPHPDKAAVEISGEDAALLHSRGVLFLDARRTAAYEEGHIAGARPFSVWEADVDDKVMALYEERSDSREQNRPIVIYCTGGACEDSHMLAQKLWGIQFNNVYVYKDGFPDWQQRGGAVRTGAQP